MNIELIMKNDITDILFEKRNKLYGAYILRKFYPERLKTSLAIMMGITAFFCMFALIPKQATQEEMLPFIEGCTMKEINPEKKPEVKPAQHPAAKQNINIAKLTSTVSIIKEKDTADILHENFDKIIIASTAILSGTDGSFTGRPSNESIAGIELTKAEMPEADPKTPINNPEFEPSYPGGMNALRTFLQRNLTNPEDLEESEQVSVKIKFIVGYDGVLKNFETLQDGGAAFNNEVMRVLKKMPQWVPGKSNGKNVSVYYTIPVKFISRD